MRGRKAKRERGNEGKRNAEGEREVDYTRELKEPNWFPMLSLQRIKVIGFCKVFQHSSSSTVLLPITYHIDHQNSSKLQSKHIIRGLNFDLSSPISGKSAIKAFSSLLSYKPNIVQPP